MASENVHKVDAIIADIKEMMSNPDRPGEWAPRHTEPTKRAHEYRERLKQLSVGITTRTLSLERLFEERNRVMEAGIKERLIRRPKHE